MPEESKDTIDDQAASHAREWEFKGDEPMRMFLAAERFTEDQRRKAQKSACNMKVEGREFLRLLWAHWARTQLRAQSLSSSLS